MARRRLRGRRTSPVGVLDPDPCPTPSRRGAENGRSRRETAAMSTVSVVTDLQGTIVQVLVAVGEPVAAGSTVAMIESMKMHHDVVALSDGVVASIAAPVGATLMPGDPVVELGPVRAPTPSAGGSALPPPAGTASTMPG